MKKIIFVIAIATMMLFVSRTASADSKQAGFNYSEARKAISLDPGLVGIEYDARLGIFKMTPGYFIPTIDWAPSSANDVNLNGINGIVAATDGNARSATKAEALALLGVDDIATPNDINLKGNSIIIKPDQNMIAAYKWITSSNRNAIMGALSSDNWRALILSPGTYTVDPNNVLDVNYIAITSLAPLGIQSITIVKTTSTSPLFIQRAPYMKMSGWTMYNATTTLGHTFVIDCNNAPSIYRYMNFRNNKALNYNSESVRGLQGIGGLWEYCNGDNSCWRCDVNQDLYATMNYCNAGNSSYQGDNDNHFNGTGKLRGCLRHCGGGNSSYASCATFGSDIAAEAVIEDCNGGNTCFSLGKTIYGTIRRCIASYESYAGTTNAMYQGKIAAGAIIEDCVADYINTSSKGSFGQINYNASTEIATNIAGIIRRCRIGTIADQQNGISRAGLIGSFTGTIQDCGPIIPINVTSATIISYWDNGATYEVNSPAPVMLTLPQAGLAKWKYRVRYINPTAGGGIILKPYNGDWFRRSTGTVLAADICDVNMAATFAEVTVEHFPSEVNVISEVNVGNWGP